MAKDLLEPFETKDATKEGYGTHEPGRPVNPEKHARPAPKTLKRLTISTPLVNVMMKCNSQGDPSTTETFVFFLRTEKGMEELTSEAYEAEALRLKREFEAKIGRTIVRWGFDPMCGGYDHKPRQVLVPNFDTGREELKTIFDLVPRPGGFKGEWL